MCKTLKKEGRAFRNIGKKYIYIFIFPTEKSALLLSFYTKKGWVADKRIPAAYFRVYDSEIRHGIFGGVKFWSIGMFFSGVLIFAPIRLFLSLGIWSTHPGD